VIAREEALVNVSNATGGCAPARCVAVPLYVALVLHFIPKTTPVTPWIPTFANEAVPTPTLVTVNCPVNNSVGTGVLAALCSISGDDFLSQIDSILARGASGHRRAG
jgi:hypothetical protein